MEEVSSDLLPASAKSATSVVLYPFLVDQQSEEVISCRVRLLNSRHILRRCIEDVVREALSPIIPPS